ncbi:biopolymer transporter ExbD [Gymnodinialimonas sp. 57CJ19]|uniref:ExbD/TolR family protein n=1 Tax=Gymnodinialimonas sp. 57CJ19 TaxID=3138498 RepID=UPI003134639B
MSLRRAPSRRVKEPTIALINVVFLMLIFFLIAGSFALPLDPRVALVDTATLEGRAPPDATVILPDGTLELRGQPVTLAEIIANTPTPRLVPDRALPAAELVTISRQLRDAGRRKSGS